MPVKNGNIFLSYQNGKNEVLTPSQYEARKDRIYKDNPTATAIQISRYDPADEDIADDDVYRISSSEEEPFEISGKQFRKNKKNIYEGGYAGLKVERLRPMKYFAEQGDKQKAIVDRQLASLDEAEKAIDEKAFAAYKEQNSQPKSFGARLLQSAASAGYANRGVSGLADPTNYSGWLNTHGKEYGDELRNYQAAKSLLKEAKTMQNTLTKDEARSAEGLGRVGKFFKGVAQGQAKTLGDVESWVPFVGAENASAMYGLQKKIESIIGNLPEDASGTAIENAIKKGLSPSERQLFDAVQTSGAVTSSLQDEIAGSVKIGEVMAMSERMGLEFLLFDSIAGSPARGAGRAVTKYLEKRLVKDGLSKGARKLAQGAAKVAGQEVKAAVGGAIQTAVGPSNWSQVAKNTEAAMQAFMSSPAQFMSPETRAKYGIKGPEQMGEMMWDGVVDMFFENATEFGLGPVNKILGAAGKGGYRALRKLGWDKLATLLSPQASAFLQKMGVASLSEELGEEVNNAIIDYFRGNKEAIGDFFDPENLGIMVASFVPTIGVGAGVSAVQRGSLKNKYNNAAAAYQDYLVNQKGMKPEDAAEVVSSVNGASPEELGHRAGILLNALDQSKGSQDKGTEAELIMNLLTTARDYNAANGVDQLVRNEEREKARDEVMKNTGNHQFWQTRPEQMLDEAGQAYIGDGEYVDYLTTDGDNNFYIRKENPDGTLETVDENGVVRTLDPADVRQGLADGTFKARKQLSMDEFLDLRNGVKKDQMWEVSAERTGVLGAYRAAERSGDSATHGDIYMVGKTVQDAAGELVSLGVDESVLDNTPEDIAKMAFEERQAGNEEVAAALSDYATAKSAYEGLHAGYMAGVTARGEKAAAEKVNQFGVQQRDGSVTVTTAALDGAPVFVLSPDAVVAQDGSVSVLGGTPESKVMVADESGNTRLVSVADLANAEVMSGEQFAEGITGYYADFAEQKYQEMQSTTPYGGKVAALAQYIGHTILIQSENGEVGSVKILNMNPQEDTATIKDVSGQGAEDSVSIEALYDMAQKDEMGNISIDPDAEDNAQLMQPSRPQAPQGGGVAVPAPSARPQGAQVNPAEIENLVGTEVPITLNGQQVNAFVSGISEGNVEFEYQNESGNTRPGTLSVEEFAVAMQGAQPAAEAETETAEPEAQSTLPRKGDDLEWNAIFSADPKTFAGYLPELVQEMHRLFPGEELKYAQSWYGKAKAELDKSKEMTGDPAKDAANKKKRAGAETKVANYGTLILALRPATQSAGASLAQAPEAQEPAAPEENVPDISDDTPSAAQKRGYVVQNGNRIDRAGEDAIVAEGDDTKISFTKTDVADAKYGLAEAERVIPSHVNGQENALHFFARDWQPKDRTRTDSEVAINQMANNLRPEEITRGVTAYGGAPVVNARGEVIQGNGRSEALRRAYEGGKADAYKAWLADNAEDFGLTREQVEAMEHPVLVRVMAVDDATAENYGKKEQKDLESGGDATFNGKTLAKKLGDSLSDFLDILFGGDLGEDANFSDYVEANGAVALRWLHQNGYIGDTEFQNAIETTKGGEQKFTDATIAAFRQLSLEPLFANGTEKVRQGYEKLSNIAKLALQRSVAKLSRLDGVVDDLQSALSYLYDYETADPTFQKAKSVEDAWKAIQEWAQNLRMDTGKSEGELHPSVVANHFAAIFKGAKKVKSITDLFDAIVAAMTGEAGLFEAGEATDRIGAYTRSGVISEEEANTLRNGTEDNNGASAPASGEQTGPAESGDSGVEGGSGEVRAEGEGDNGAESGGAAPAESAGEGEGAVARKPQTLAEAREYFENLYGKGAKAERYIRVWELTNKKNQQPAEEGGLVNRMARVIEEPVALSAEEAAELEQLGIQIAVDAITDEGYVKFPQFFKNLVETFGNGIRPYVKSIYLGASAKVSDEIADQMDDRQTVRSFDENIDINEIGNEQDTTGIRETGGTDETVAGDTTGGAGEESAVNGTPGDNSGDTTEDTGAGAGESAPEGGVAGEQGTLWDTGESDNAPANGEGNGGRANGGKRTGGRTSGTKGGRTGTPESGSVPGGQAGVGREPGGQPGTSVDPAVAAAEAEQKAYEAEKEAIKNDTDTDKLKAKKDELKSQISGVEDPNDLNKAKMNGQLRAVIERLRELFAKSADKSQTLAQEKVPYESIADPTGEHSIGSVVPSGAADAMRDALKRVEAEQSKTIAEFVREELGYESLDEMFTGDGKDIGLSAEQVDSVGLAIHQMKNGNMFIVGDMTGVGKGRQGAAIIRWAIRNGKKVLFVTETPDLFSDMYQDLEDIGDTNHVPFVVNNEPIVDKGTKETILKAPGRSVANALYNSESDALPVVKWRGKDKGKPYNFVMMTYSQAQAARTAASKKKLDWIKMYAKDAIVICDESHNASGDSNRGRYFRDIVLKSQAPIFMSATFAKRPDNMVLYALRSSLRDANMSQEDMVKSIEKYGVPMQEIIAAGLFKTGEMVRRERDFSDVKTHWDSPEDTFTEEEIKQSRATYDKTIQIVNDIILFQRGVIDPVLKKKNKEEFEEANAAAMELLLKSPEGTKVTVREYTNTPYSSQVSNIANLMFYGIKAKKAAEMAIEQIKKGEKPIIAVEHTLDSYIKDVEGDVPSADFAFILSRGLERSLKYRLKKTVKWINPDTHQIETVKEDSTVTDMGSAEALVGNMYSNGLRKKIHDYSTDEDVMPLMLSPIDYVKRRIEEAGYRCGEITGRNWQLIQNEDGTWHKEPIKLDKTAEISAFNGGTAKNPLKPEETSNAIILNTAGATGISLHSSRRFGDQKKRCMIILQPARNVNTEVQVRGRGDRTGQVHRCEYFYITSPIPAEKKVIMMLRQKLASLDANAVGTENVSSNKVNADDMDNKYGDEVARQFLIDHPEINNKLDSPLQKNRGEWEKREGLLYELLIGIQRMSCATQEMVLKELESAYVDQIEYLNQNGINDLATTAMNLEAVTIDTGVFIKGKDNDSMSEFAHDTLIERMEVNVLKKPLRSSDIYARMKKLGALTEDGKIDPEYGQKVFASAMEYADKVRADLRNKQAADRELLRESVMERTPRPEGMSDEEYEALIDNDNEYRAFVLNQEEEYRRIDNDYATQCGRVMRATDALKPGMPCLVPLTDDLNGQKRYGRFIAFKTPKDGKPKGIKAVFAVTDARASIEIPVVSMYEGIENIINDVYGRFGFGDELRSIGGDPYDRDITDEDRRAARDEWWDTKVPKETTRQIRYMVTGNIFQACGSLGEYKGTITTFTRKDKDTGEITIEKGMLLAEDFDPEDFKVRRQVTKDDVWESYDRVFDDVTNISVRREGDKLIVSYEKPRRSKEKLSNHPFLQDDELKALVDNNEIVAYSRDELRATVSEENVDAVLEHLYKEYKFTIGELFVMPDSTERVDAIVYSGKPFAEVIEELGNKYGLDSKWEVERALKRALERYKMDINNEELKKQIQDYVQLRQAYYRKDASKMDSVNMAWDVIINDERIADNKQSKEEREQYYIKREAEKEELAARGIHGTAKHYESGKTTLDFIKGMFKEFNSDKTNEEYFNKILPVVSKLGMEIVFNEKTPANTGGFTGGQVVQYNWKYMNADWITDQMKADTILHELVHTVTAYAKECCDRGYEHLLPEELIDLVSQLDNIFSAIKYNSNFRHDTGDGASYTDYGLKNTFEMLAEAGSNEDFRKDLRKTMLGVKMLSGMLSFSDVTNRDDYTGKKQTAEEAVLERLDALIDAFNEHAFVEFYRGTGYGARNYYEVKKADDKAQQFEDIKKKIVATRDLEDKAQLVLGLRNVVETMTDAELLRSNYDLPGHRELEEEIAKRGLNPRPNMDGPKTEVDRRVDYANERATEKVLDGMGNTLGIKVNRISRADMPKGHKTEKGYYNPATGEVFVCTDNVTDERDAIATVFHEAVGHLGLRQLFGSDFNDAMRNIYAGLGRQGRAWVHHYMETHDLQPGDEGIIIGMEEYLSHLAERMNEEPSLWQKIQDIIGRIIDSIFHINGFRFTDNELNYILRASYEHLKDPNWLNTPKGRAFNTLLKRQLGINETDPNKPTDPQGPDAGLRFRDGDETGVANVDYDAQMKKWQTAAVMQNQDKDLPVKIGMEKVMKEVGMKALTDDTDYLTRHNQASSRAETEAHDFELFYFKPMLAQVRAIQERLIGKKATDDQRELAYEKILDYIYAVSGLERNKYKNDEIEAEKQEALNILRANAEAKAEEARQNGESTQEIYDELAKREKAIEKKFEEKKRDWSGLSSLMGMHRSEWREAEVKAQEMVDAFRKEVGDDAELEKLWDSIRACTDFSLDHAYKHGLLTREEYERLHGTASQPRMWEHYVPLRGFNETTAEEEYEYSYNNMANSKVNSVVVKKMNGRWTQADNPLANILNIAETEIVQGNENWAKQALYRFVLQAGENSLLTQKDAWYVKNDDGTWELAIPEEKESFEEFEKRMQELHDNIQPDGTQGKPKAKRGRKGLALRNILANKADRNKHLIRLKVGGMDKMIWVNGDPKLAEAVMGSGRENNYKTIRKVSRALSNLFTTYSIDFTARNLIRDTIYSRLALMVKEDNAYRSRYRKNWRKNFGHGVGFAYPMIKLMAEWESGKLQTKENLTKTEKMFIDFMHDGGQTGYTIINSVSEIKKSLERTMRKAGKEMGAVQIPVLGHIARAIKTLNEAFELLTRFTAYETSRDMGRSGQRSASDAKEISVNFNRRGAQTQDGVWGHIASYLGATQYFYNAGVQGFQNFMHLFKVNPKKMGVATGSLVVLGILTPLINSLIAGLADGIGGGDDNGDDWYWNLPEWVRRNNLVLGVPGFYVAIPLSVELRAFYGLGDIVSSLLYGKATARNGWDITLDMLDVAAEILPLNPVEGFTASRNASKNIVQNIGESVGRAIAPDAGMFIVDIMTNRDFTGRPLWKENPFSNTTPRSQSAYASTPKALVEACQGLAKLTNGGIDIPPGAMRDIFRNLGGGLYNLAEDASKLLYADIERPRRWDDIPFFSGFTGHLDKDRMNSFASNALFDYKSNSDDVVRRLNAAAGTDKITKKIAYENPESLPKSARVQMMLEGENYILGKMYYEGMKNEYVMKRRKRTTKYGKEGEWYKSREVKTYGVEALGEQWKTLRDEWYAMPEKTKEERDAKKAFSLDVQDAWHRYCNAQNNLVDRLMDEEYYNAETKRKNGIPYEPKRRLNEWGYDKVKDLFE